MTTIILYKELLLILLLCAGANFGCTVIVANSNTSTVECPNMHAGCLLGFLHYAILKKATPPHVSSQFSQQSTIKTPKCGRHPPPQYAKFSEGGGCLLGHTTVIREGSRDSTLVDTPTMNGYLLLDNLYP